MRSKREREGQGTLSVLVLTVLARDQRTGRAFLKARVVHEEVDEEEIIGKDFNEIKDRR